MCDRSADKLHRLQDQRGAFEDLDLLIGVVGDGAYNELRISKLIGEDDLVSARADIEIWLRQAHGDNRGLYPAC